MAERKVDVRKFDPAAIEVALADRVAKKLAAEAGGPAGNKDDDYSGTVMVRMPPSLHRRLKQICAAYRARLGASCGHRFSMNVLCQAAIERTVNEAEQEIRGWNETPNPESRPPNPNP